MDGKYLNHLQFAENIVLVSEDFATTFLERRKAFSHIFEQYLRVGRIYNSHRLAGLRVRRKILNEKENQAFRKHFLLKWKREHASSICLYLQQEKKILLHRHSKIHVNGLCFSVLYSVWIGMINQKNDINRNIIKLMKFIIAI